MQVRVEVAELVKETLVGFRVHVRPVAGEIEDVRATVPVKLATLLRLIVETALVPILVVDDIGLEPMMKSASWALFTCLIVTQSKLVTVPQPGIIMTCVRAVLVPLVSA